MITNIDDLEVGALVNAEKIKGVPVDDTAIDDGKVLSYDGVNGKLIYKKVESGSGVEGGSGVWGGITGNISAQTDLQTALNGKANTSHIHTIANVTNLQTTLDDKVDKVVGKGLSTNDYSDTDKAKLLSIRTNGQLDILLDTKVDKITGKGLSTNDLTNELKVQYDSAVLLSHTHTNKTLLDSLVSYGDGTKYLSDDGTYKMFISGSNSSATDTNTPNTIVARDSSGNFTAGTITATLNGWATAAHTLRTSRTIGAMTGDVISLGSRFNGGANNTNVNTIANNVVDNNKLADMPTMTLKGNDTLITGNPKDLTVSEVQTMITDSTHRFVTDSQISQWNTPSSSVGTFVELTDTPNAYTGQANKYVRVNSTADGLEFIEGTGGGVASFTQLNDVPTSYIGQANKMVTVNDSETGLDFTDMPIIPTKTSNLTNDSNFITDNSYIHTDNNYTTIEKTKLSTIEKGAKVNVQSDWNEINTLSDSFIKNKPTIPNKISQLSNDSGFISDSNYVHTDNNLSNAIKTAYDLSVTNTHTHNNKVILDNIVASGDGSKFLSDDGTYKTIVGGGGSNPTIEADITKTVGIGGDFTTINGALEFLSKSYITYKNTGVKVKIQLLSGFIMKEQVIVDGVDLGWIEISGVDTETIVDRESLTITKLIGGITHRPVFLAKNNATLPIINQLFNMNTSGEDNWQTGIVVVGLSKAIIEKEKGIKNAIRYGLYVSDGSYVLGSFGIFSSSFTGAAFLNNSKGILNNSKISGVSTGISINTSSSVNLSSATIDGGTVDGISLNNNSSVDFSYGILNSTGKGITVFSCSSICANYSKINNQDSGTKFSVFSGGTISASGNTTTGSATLYNIAINTLSSKGIIYA